MAVKRHRFRDCRSCFVLGRCASLGRRREAVKQYVLLLCVLPLCCTSADHIESSTVWRSCYIKDSWHFWQTRGLPSMQTRTRHLSQNAQLPIQTNRHPHSNNAAPKAQASSSGWLGMWWMRAGVANTRLASRLARGPRQPTSCFVFGRGGGVRGICVGLWLREKAGGRVRTILHTAQPKANMTAKNPESTHGGVHARVHQAALLLPLQKGVKPQLRLVTIFWRPGNLNLARRRASWAFGEGRWCVGWWCVCVVSIFGGEGPGFFGGCNHRLLQQHPVDQCAAPTCCLHQTKQPNGSTPP